MKPELLKIDFEKGVLKTPLHSYRIVKSISVKRYKQFELLQSEVAFGFTFEEIFAKLSEMKTHLNKLQFVEMSVLVDNMLNGITRGIEKRTPPTLKLCALFMIREDEDVKEWNETLQQEKYEDFENAGVDMMDFSELSMNLIPALLKVYNEISRTTSEGAGEMIQKIIKESLSNITEKEKLE